MTNCNSPQMPTALGDGSQELASSSTANPSKRHRAPKPKGSTPPKRLTRAAIRTEATNLTEATDPNLIIRSNNKKGRKLMADKNQKTALPLPNRHMDTASTRFAFLADTAADGKKSRHFAVSAS